MKQTKPKKRTKVLAVLGLSFMLLWAGNPVSAQTRPITGTVRDAQGPMAGVTVMVQGTTTGVSTDSEGRYSVKAPAGSTLEFSFVGYTDVKMEVGDRQTIDVVMREAATDLDEVVVVGYGTVRKRDLTGAIQSVKNEDLVKTPTSNVMEALAGRVAGLSISVSDGRATSGVNMTLRGSRSLSGSNTPYIIIDGVPGQYNDLNPNDVESIEVLKDASSTAIYGSAGANGVIIITTKSGNKNGKVTVNFDAYRGVNGYLQFPEVRTGEEYIKLRREAHRTAGTWNPGDSDAILFSNAEWEAVQNNQWIDWLDLGTRNGVLQNYSISASGGTEKTRGYLSLSYYEREGFLPGDELTRYGLKTTVDHQIRPWASIGVNLVASYTKSSERNGRYFTRVFTTLPLGTPFLEDGTINPYPLAGNTGTISPIADQNPVQFVNDRRQLAFNPTAYLEIKPLKGLSFKTMLSAYLSTPRTGTYNGRTSMSGTTRTSAGINSNNIYNYKWENILNYNFTVNQDHNFAITGVTSWTKDRKETYGMTGYNIDWDGYTFYRLQNSTTTDRSINSSYTEQQSLAFIARINYSYKGRYLLSISNRTEGASVLASGNRWDNFPAVSAAWRISDEAFLKDSGIYDLKLRVGYGVTGNSGASPYSTQNIGRMGTNFAFQNDPAPYYGFAQSIPNANLGWEKSYGTNVGVDLGLFNNRLSMTLDLYHVKTKDILYKRTLPASTGAAGTSNLKILENICATVNRGLDIVINSVNIRKKDFEWTTAFTFNTNHEEITDFTQDVPVSGSNKTWLIKGHPIQSLYDYKYAGIFQTEEEAQKYNRHMGDVKIEEVPDENGNVNYSYGSEDMQVLGQVAPKWTAGLQNTLVYKGIDLSFFLDARWGNTINHWVMSWYNGSGNGNGPKMLDYWTPENPGGRFPRPNTAHGTTIGNNPTVGTSSLTYIDGSYIKLRNITLGYSLPARWLKKIPLERFRIYATVSNPWTWTKSKYLKDWDPERGHRQDEWPLSRQMVFGVNITF